MSSPILSRSLLNYWVVVVSDFWEPNWLDGVLEPFHVLLSVEVLLFSVVRLGDAFFDHPLCQVQLPIIRQHEYLGQHSSVLVELAQFSFDYLTPKRLNGLNSAVSKHRHFWIAVLHLGSVDAVDPNLVLFELSLDEKYGSNGVSVVHAQYLGQVGLVV